MSTKQGAVKCRDKAREVLFTKFLQLHDADTLMLARKKDLTKEQIKRSLRVISILKEKSDGILKGRAAAFSKT